MRCEQSRARSIIIFFVSNNTTSGVNNVPCGGLHWPNNRGWRGKKPQKKKKHPQKYFLIKLIITKKIKKNLFVQIKRINKKQKASINKRKIKAKNKHQL